MLGGVLIFLGAALLGFGTVMLSGWVSGKGEWFDEEVYGRRGNTKTDRMLLDVYFVAKVVAPLLGGAVLILLGLREWL
jgi:hypothetical protein